MTTTIKLGDLTGEYVLDTGSRIGFVARHTMATKVPGQFDEFEGIVHLDGENPSKSSVRLTIQAKSIQTRNPRRDEDLRTKFLDIGSHPTITFNSTKVRQADETNFTITGHLTIRGVTRPVIVNVQLIGTDTGPGRTFTVDFRGGVTISRKDWGVNWNAATGFLVSDKVTLEFDVAAIRQNGNGR